MPKMDFLGTEGKPVFKKRVHRPWNSKLLDTETSHPNEIIDTKPITNANHQQNLLAEKLHTNPESIPTADLNQHLNHLYDSNITIGGFLRVPARDIISANQPTTAEQNPVFKQPWQKDLAEEKQRNSELLSEKIQLEQKLNGLLLEMAEKNELFNEYQRLENELRLLQIDKDTVDADYQMALQYLNEERQEKEKLQNDLWIESQNLQTEMTRRVQAERNEGLLNETFASLESDRILLDKNKKNLELETLALNERKQKMDTINANEQKLRKLYEDTMKGLHEKIFELERHLTTEREQKQNLEEKLTQFFEKMKQTEEQKIEIANQHFSLQQEIKLLQHQLSDLEIMLKDEIKVRKAYESTFSDALSKN